MNLFTTGDHQGHRQHHPHALQHQSIYDPNIKRLGIPASSLDPTQSKKGLVFLKLFIIIKVIKLIFEETCTVSCESVLFFFYCGIILWYYIVVFIFEVEMMVNVLIIFFTALLLHLFI